MKKRPQIAVLAAATLVLAFAAARVVAWPSGPSAKEAARLKYYPPHNYLEHYLGDDRYKIAGGVWKVVSTNLDTYYHRPDCPNMMRQPAGLVIGFSSAAEAAEGGYKPDPTCSPNAFAVIFAQNPNSAKGMRGRGKAASPAAIERYTQFLRLYLATRANVLGTNVKDKASVAAGETQVRNLLGTANRTQPPSQFASVHQKLKASLQIYLSAETKYKRGELGAAEGLAAVANGNRLYEEAFGQVKTLLGPTRYSSLVLAQR